MFFFVLCCKFLLCVLDVLTCLLLYQFLSLFIHCFARLHCIKSRSLLYHLFIKRHRSTSIHYRIVSLSAKLSMRERERVRKVKKISIFKSFRREAIIKIMDTFNALSKHLNHFYHFHRNHLIWSRGKVVSFGTQSGTRWG